MTTTAKTLEEYFSLLPPERREPLKLLRDLAYRTLVPDFEESVGYVGINYSVPLKVFPAGYHCTPGEPLPFITLASQARHIALYHMGLYADPELLVWFQQAWAERVPYRLDMGKSCLRFSNPAKIPYELIEELLCKMDTARWISLYEKMRDRR